MTIGLTIIGLTLVYYLAHIIISIYFHIKYKLVPSFYLTLWLLSLYCISFLIIILAVIRFQDSKLLISLIIYIIVMMMIFWRFKKSIKKSIQLRLNKKLLKNGIQIEINKLKYHTYKPIRQYYLGYYTGKYETQSGKTYTFESEDYFDSSRNILLIKKFKPKKNVIVYVDPNDESKYYYKLKDFK